MLKVLNSSVKEEPPVTKRSKKPGSAPDFGLGGNKVFFISLGCPRNLVDTEVMIGILLQAGYEACSQQEEADFIVINTCGFLESSRQESLDTIGDSIKNRKKGAKVIATGCMVQSHSDVIKQHFPEIHYLLGSGDVKEILKAVETKEAGSVVSDAKSFIEMGEVPRTISTPSTYAYLKIAEGCRKRCSFCKIPSIKGPLKSKPIEQITKEVDILLKSGKKELILIAQDLGDWGKDMGYKHSHGLVELLKAILKDERDFSLRLLYLYPDEITDELISVMKQDKRIVPYLDMPIQHINDEMLKAMRRTTNKEQIVTTLTKLRREIPNIAIRTSLMVGFPGETEEQFAELCEFIKEMPLDNVGIFKFSKEEGTHAATLDKHVPEDIKETRFKTLSELQQKLVHKRNNTQIGKKIEVLVEGYHPESRLLMRGRHDGQCPEIDGMVIINDGRKVTQFGKKYLVEVTDVTDYDLIGKVI